MIVRRVPCPLLSLLALPLFVALCGCSSLQSIAILPAAGSTVLTAIGQTAQYTAFGQSQMGSAQPTTSNVTSSVTWSVSDPNVATISSTGVVAAVGAGYSQIYAKSGGLIATSDVTVTLATSANGGSSGSSITVTPSTAAETFIGETTQFIATGSLAGTSGSQDLTNQVQWTSSNSQVATISSTGLATAIGSGTTTIVAQSGGTTGAATITVAAGTSSTPTLTLIPSSDATATFTGETTQFIALGNLSGGIATQNLTNSVVWSSSDVAVATIDQNGLATAVAANITQPVVTTITAIGTTSTGSLITATAQLTALPAGGSVILPTLAVYEVGTGTGTVTATVPSSSGTTISCGSPTGTSCTGNYPLGATVTLTAAPAAGSFFGGWSIPCNNPPNSPSTSCTFTMDNNTTIGAIFNP